MEGIDIGPVAANEPYSPRATCARSCHIANGDPVDSPGHDYGSGLALSLHDQGVHDGGAIYWQSYETKAFAHGVSVSRHMNQGRNETYTHVYRSTFGDPWFTSTPGMYGKY